MLNLYCLELRLDTKISGKLLQPNLYDMDEDNRVA